MNMPPLKYGSTTRVRAARWTHRCRAFTFVELLVVLSVIAVLTAALLPSVPLARSKAQQASCAMNLKELGVAWGMFYDEHDGWFLPALMPAKLPEMPANFPDDAKAPGVWWARLVDLGYVGEEAEGPNGLFRCPTDPKPVRAPHGGKTYSLSYGYSDCFGYPYSTNPNWPKSGSYGLKRRDRIRKRPGRTPVMVELADCGNKGRLMVISLGGYGTWPLSKWIHFPHDGTGNVLYDDGSVVAELADGPLATVTAQDCF